MEVQGPLCCQGHVVKKTVTIELVVHGMVTGWSVNIVENTTQVMGRDQL